MGKNVIERISEVIRHYHVSVNELAKKMDISAPNAYNYLTKGVQPPLSFVIRFLEVFDDVSAEWLLRGEGEMLKPAKKNHYLEMAERVNGTMMASEDGISPTSYRSIIESIEKMSDRIQRLEEMTRKK